MWPYVKEIYYQWEKCLILFLFCPVFLKILIYRELQPQSGDVMIAGDTSYCSQEPWIIGTTVYENILFGASDNSERMNLVLDSCALRRDMELLPNGLDTMVGERGVTLSGGQKARVSLARAVYRDVDIYLFDDPLSAVDAKVCVQLLYCRNNYKMYHWPLFSVILLCFDRNIPSISNKLTKQ